MVKKEDMVKVASKLMNKRENIRNIGIVAHIDHGKCVSADSKIALADGRFIRADELFELISKFGKPVKKGRSEIIYECSNPEYKTFSLNKKSLCIEKIPISHAWKLKADKLVEITLSTGRKIKVTPEHKFLVLNPDGNIIEKEARLLSNKDFILCPKKLMHEALSLEELKSIFLELIAEDEGFYVILEDDFGIKLKQKIIKAGLKAVHSKIKSKLSAKSFYHGVYKCRYRVKDYLKIAEEFSIKHPYDKIKLLNYRKTLNKADHSSVYIQLPKTHKQFAEFMYLLGLIYGDGSSGREIRITNNNPHIQNEIRNIVRSVFGKEVKIRKYKNKASRIDLTLGKTFAKMLYRIFGLPEKAKSRSLSIPQIIFRMHNELIASFLQGYYDSDGSVEFGRRAVSLSAVSKRVIEDIHNLLLILGVIATYNGKKNSLYISGSNLEKFSEVINFRHPLKAKRLERLLKNSCMPNRNTDLLPLSSELLKDLRIRIGISQNAISKSYFAIERNQIPIYANNLADILNKFYSFIGNPKVKDYDAFEKLQHLESIIAECHAARVTEVKEIKFNGYVYDFTVPKNHNFIAEGMIIHNTTLTDNLIAAAGLMSEELAGKMLAMDFEDQEQERGITINAANISLAHKINDEEYLINVIDTPGHVDFGGDVIRAMRAVDGVILVVDAVEGVMPQTETVLRQALREYVKPVLFINKVDRLINELQISPEEMQQRFIKTIATVNELIKKNAPEQFVKEWQVNAANGSVAFGSAVQNWAISVPFMQKSGINFKDIYAYCREEKQKELAKKSPLHAVVLDMVVKHLPNPLVAQKYRIPVIWTGSLDSEVAKKMLECSDDEPFSMMVTDVRVDPYAGDIATGRVFSGKIKRGMKVKLLTSKKEVSIQKVGVFMGPELVEVEEIPAGNIAAIVGCKDVYAGETISTEEMKPFEDFMSSFEPVITVSIEPKHPKDLPKLIKAISQLTKEDPNLVATLNKDTGEHLLSGMGELHLEVNEYRIRNKFGIDIVVSNPIVVFHETICKESPTVEAKTPNKHNKFFISVKPIPKEILQKLIESKIEGKIRPKDKELIDKLVEIGFDRDDAKRIWCVHNNNVLIDKTRGIIALFEVKEMIIDAFKSAMDEGPLAKEKCFGIQVILHDAVLHEDAIHRGPAQVLPAVTKGIYACIMQADPVIYEPKQKLTIVVPESFMGAVTKELSSRRTQILEMRQEGDQTVIIGKAPVKELIGFSQAIRSATQGRAIWTAEYAGYEMLPREMQREVIKSIRLRKGLSEEPKPASFFLD